MCEVLNITCSQCGKPLQIPAELQEFSCMYCGARLTQAPVPVPADADGAAAAAYYKENILAAVAEHTNMERFITKDKFAPAFEAYTQDTAEIFRQLDTAVSCGCLTLEDAVEEFLSQLEVRWDGKRSRLDADKFTIAVFLVPMVRRLALPVSEEYCKLLCQTWRSRYPKSPFEIGDYDSIAKGFQKKFLGLCFITTAVCLESGKPDDCAELSAFRQFRDGYLRTCPDGPALIEEYYEIAPQIVARIELSPDKTQRYDAIRTEHLEPCYADLLAGRLAQCKEKYVTMVRTLQQEYLS